MIRSFRCHFERSSFLLELNSCHVNITKSISLAKRKFLVVTRVLSCSAIAFVWLLSFQLILSTTSCTLNPYYHTYLKNIFTLKKSSVFANLQMEKPGNWFTIAKIWEKHLKKKEILRRGPASFFTFFSFCL